MKNLVCLLSKQPIPNLLSIHELRPDRVILLESKDMVGAAEQLLNALAIGGAKFSLRRDAQFNVSLENAAHVIPIPSVHDFASIGRELDDHLRSFSGEEWIVNLTGGNKLMALAAYEYFKPRNATFCYVEIGQPRRLISLNSDVATQVCQHRLSIAEFLAGYGFQLRRSESELDELKRRDRLQWETSRILALHSTGDDLFPFDSKQRETLRRNKPFTLSSEMLQPLDPNVRLALVKCFRGNEESGIVLGKENLGAEFVTGGWLEVFVWGLFDRHADKLGLFDAQRGVKPYHGNDREANDMDVVIINDNDRRLELIAVECKTGKQDHGSSADIFYKIDSVVGQSQALGARGVLATTSDFIIDKQQGDLKPRIRELAELLRLKIITRDEIHRLARDPDNAELLKELFGL